MNEQVYMNRELSWLKFNARVLEEAERKDNPLCERLSFASIYQSNLDEFFMVRVGSLVDTMELDPKLCENKTNMTSGEQIDAIIEKVTALNQKKDEIYNELMTEVSNYGITLKSFCDLEDDEQMKLEKFFTTEIAPLLSPVVVGKRNPFPFLKNEEIYAVVVLSRKSSGKDKLGIISCSSNVFPRLIKADDGSYMLSEELILHFVSQVFSEYTVKSKSLIRVTRNADIDTDALYDNEWDYREFMVDIIKRRKKLAPVRLEISRDLDNSVLRTLCRHLELDKKFIFKNNSPLDLSFVFDIRDTLRQQKELFYPKRFPQKSTQIREGFSILKQVKERDRILSYPFDSIAPFIDMLHEAANDEDVVSIKITLYRVAKNSKIVEALVEAAENGKDVLVLVELKARFDEENNIGWSRLLEDAGCKVIYGLNGYKVHSKLCLITKRTNDKNEYYVQVGTGNYNEKTSRLYTDLSLITCNRELGENALEVFNALASDDTLKTSAHLLVAPNCLRNKILEMADEQITLAKEGKPAYIGIKMNSFTDKKIIDKFIEASQAGVKIELVVRGICCLISGIEGKTENIRVISIVGRFLEHSRIYMFGSGLDRKIYISSADLMTRNTIRRVEVAVPIYDKDIRRQLIYMFSKMLEDNCNARELKSNGEYELVSNDNPKLCSQEHFYDISYAQAKFVAENKDLFINE